MASGESQLYCLTWKKKRRIQDSVLNFYKKLIALRKDPEYKETVVYGAFGAIYEGAPQSDGLTTVSGIRRFW